MTAGGLDDPTHQNINVGATLAVALDTPTVNVEVFSQAPAMFAQEAGVGPDKRMVLLLDRAGWHTSPKLTVPEGIHLAFLPPSSPELQPAERLWPRSNERIAPSLLLTSWNAAIGYKLTLH